MHCFSHNLQSLMNRMWQMGYGTLRRVPIHNGDIATDPTYEVIRTVRFTSPAAERPDPAVPLKPEHFAFAAEVQSIGNGVIDVIKVHAGLPVSLEISERP